MIRNRALETGPMSMQPAEHLETSCAIARTKAFYDDGKTVQKAIRCGGGCAGCQGQIISACLIGETATASEALNGWFVPAFSLRNANQGPLMSLSDLRSEKFCCNGQDIFHHVRRAILTIDLTGARWRCRKRAQRGYRGCFTQTSYSGNSENNNVCPVELGMIGCLGDIPDHPEFRAALKRVLFEIGLALLTAQ
jgi:hypothetical protein